MNKREEGEVKSMREMAQRRMRRKRENTLLSKENKDLAGGLNGAKEWLTLAKSG